MTYVDDELSAEASRPVEIYQVDLPTISYFLTSAGRDFAPDGIFFYRATAGLTRGNITQPQPGQSREMTMTLPVTHDIAQAWLLQGCAPQSMLVTITQFQRRSNGFSRIWKGFATSIAIGGENDLEATFRIPSKADDALKQLVPNVVVDATACQNVLYDTSCQADRSLHQVLTAITAIAGPVITVRGPLAAIVGGEGPSIRATFGEVVHGITGERRSVIFQPVNGGLGVGPTDYLNLTLNTPFTVAANGDPVTVFSGCTHEIQYCKSVFGNVVNYLGTPNIPVVNIFIPGGTGAT